MNSITTQPPISNSPADGALPKASLAKFIEDNSKMVASIAAFFALTAFSTQLANSDIKFWFSAFSFLGALLLSIELYFAFPPPPHEWRLRMFSEVLVLLVVVMTCYWFSTFLLVWIPLALLFVMMLVYLSLIALLAYPLKKTIRFAVNRILKHEPSPNTARWISLVVFLSCAITIFIGLNWILQKVDRHPSAISTPIDGSTKTDRDCCRDDY